MEMIYAAHTSRVCGQVVLKLELGDELSDRKVVDAGWLDPNIAVMVARNILDAAIEQGATNVDEHFGGDHG